MPSHFLLDCPATQLWKTLTNNQKHMTRVGVIGSGFGVHIKITNREVREMYGLASWIATHCDFNQRNTKPKYCLSHTSWLSRLLTKYYPLRIGTLLQKSSTKSICLYLYGFPHKFNTVGWFFADTSRWPHDSMFY